MKVASLHRWAISPRQAIAVQNRLRPRVVTHDDLGEIRRVAGVDVAFAERGRRTFAAVVVFSFPELSMEELKRASVPTRFPYVPGLLSFRELPAVVRALRRLRRAPDLILCDGQGYAHPRRFGIACHLGLLADTPAIGIGKTRLIGEHGKVPEKRGQWTPLTDSGEVIGAVVRTRENVRPVYVSCGHRVELQSAIDLVNRCVTRYRLPEPIRMADHHAGRG